MAFTTSGFLGRVLRPKFYGLNSVLSGTEMQIRGFAARKGTREKALKKKRAIKLKKAAQAIAQEKQQSRRTLAPDVKKTDLANLAPPPTHVDVYFSNLYRPKEYSLLEAIECHSENLHKTVLDSEKSLLNVFIELNMTAEKATRVINPWKNIIVYPNVFELGFKKKVLVICQDEYKKKAIEYGAEAAGGSNLIKQIKKGDFDPSTFDCIICQFAMLDEISLIRAHLKLLYPKQSNGTLAVDFLSAIERIKYGIEYSCHLSQDDRFFGWIETTIGYINMNPVKLEENFKALVANINLKRPKRDGDFITHVYCTALPSRERLKIDYKMYQKEIDESNVKNTEAVDSKTKEIAAADASN